MEWEEYRSITGRFVAEVPGTPQVTEEEDKKDGSVYHRFVVSGGGRDFIVMYTDYSEAVVDRVGPDGIMEAERDSFAKGVNGDVSEEKRVSCGEHPGRRFLVTNDKGQWFSLRICLARPRMYILVAVSPKGPLPEETASRFLNSFSILRERGE